MDKTVISLLKTLELGGIINSNLFRRAAVIGTGYSWDKIRKQNNAAHRIRPPLLQPAPGLASYKLGQKTIISERYAQIVQAPIYIVHDMTALAVVFQNFQQSCLLPYRWGKESETIRSSSRRVHSPTGNQGFNNY
ncbi:hypothetical protein VN97_g1529 [Penicillium thymicola]|uniref:Uncharacterized protein n=1 Tax=Penicillium thymicola TaxID=293382 RepID=A0AAI9TQT1_PENTH|nr:hypothetical protein VN97_g1529 [Penicillium thymicola]